MTDTKDKGQETFDMKIEKELNNATILVTGAAGFIGAALTQRILRECKGSCIIGLDCKCQALFYMRW